MKRFNFFLISFLLVVFILSQSVFAASQNDIDISGYDSWSDADKKAFWGSEIFSILGAVSGMFIHGNVSESRQVVEDVYRDMYSASDYNSYEDFLASKVTTDDKGNLVLDDDVLAFLNKVLDSLKEDSTYVDGFPIESSNILGGSFDTGYRYKNFCSLVSKFKECYVSFTSIFGFSIKVGDNSYSCWKVFLYEDPEYAVSSDISNPSLSVGLYNGNWDPCKRKVVYIVGDSERVVFQDAETNEMVIKYFYEFDYDDIAYNNESFYAKLSFYPGFSHAVVVPSGELTYYCSDKPGSVPIFKSINDMKNGTSAGLQAQYMPGYTGQPITNNTISQKEINDFSTTYNYYYGSGSSGGGSGSGSGSGSSGGWLDSILNGLGSLGKVVMSILSKLFEMVTKVIEFFTVTLKDAMDTIPTGYANFLAALFPFLPKEWITAVTLFLGLLVAGVLIKIISKFF